MKILIIDDEVIVAKSLMRAFAASGHEVFMAHDGERGLKLWLEESPDAIFIDVLMPGLTGPQVIEEYQKNVKKKSKPNFVILMTAHSSVKHKENAQKLGAHDFIQKPFENIFSVVKKVEDFLKSGG